MSRAYNFAAGPGAVPEPVLRRAQAELLEWDGARASIMEISHRGRLFAELAAESERDLRSLLNIPQEYKVLFLQGGATQHFAQIPMNLVAPGRAVDYVVTGHWSEKAVREAAALVPVRVAATSADNNYTALPPRAGWRLNPDAAYLHYTPNETIHGIEFNHIPDVGDVPLVADMSSNILSGPIDVRQFGLIYAGAQKNISAAGLVVMIVREDLLARCPTSLPKIFNYAEHAAQGSMLNTPNTFGWYLAGLVFKWLLDEGGLDSIGERNRAKADLLYGYIDASDFYRNPVDHAARSRMNVPFTLPREELNGPFLADSEAAGLLALKGHKAVGGMRASLYNAMPLEGVQALVDFMRDFARRHG